MFDKFLSYHREEILLENSNTVAQGKAFSRKMIEYWMSHICGQATSFDDIENDILECDGAYDGGIDAAYFSKSSDNSEYIEGSTWYIFQSKFGLSFKGNNTIVSEAIKLFNTIENGNTKLNANSSLIVESVRSFHKVAGDHDRLVFVYLLEDRLDETQGNYLREIEEIGKKKFGDTLFSIEVFTLRDVYDDISEEKRDGIKIPLLGTFVTPDNNGTMYTGIVGLKNMFTFLHQHGSITLSHNAIYEKNVRQFLLPTRSRVNKEMAKTLQESPEIFGIYNNGITIVADAVESCDDPTHLILVNPSVVNGCQTTNTIRNYCRVTKKLGKDISGYVVTKIVITTDREQVANVARYSNTQNSIREKDFSEMNSKGKLSRLQQELHDKYGVMIEIKRGEIPKSKDKGGSHHILPVGVAFDLLKVYGSAWLSEPGKAFAVKEYNPNGSSFKTIIDDIECDDILAAYYIWSTTVPSSDGKGGSLLYSPDAKEQGQYRFGIGSGKIKNANRKLTRYLYYYCVGNLLTRIIGSKHTGQYNEKQAITRSIIELFKSEHKSLARDLCYSAVMICDDYLDKNNDDSVYNDAGFIDLTKYLRSSTFSQKSFTPKLHIQSDMMIKSLRRDGTNDRIYSVIGPILES